MALASGHEAPLLPVEAPVDDAAVASTSGRDEWWGVVGSGGEQEVCTAEVRGGVEPRNCI